MTPTCALHALRLVAQESKIRGDYRSLNRICPRKLNSANDLDVRAPQTLVKMRDCDFTFLASRSVNLANSTDKGSTIEACGIT